MCKIKIHVCVWGGKGGEEGVCLSLHNARRREPVNDFQNKIQKVDFLGKFSIYINKN